MIPNYLQKLVDSSNQNERTTNLSPRIIGGINFGRSWTDDDAALLNLMSNSANAQMQLEMIEDERLYNSPQQQVDRLRKAGINPDYANIDTGNTSASYSPQSLGASGQPAKTQGQFASEVVGGLIQLVPQAVSLVQQIQGSNLDNGIKEAQLYELSRGNALNLISGSVSLDDLEHGALPNFAYFKTKKFGRAVDDWLRVYRGNGPSTSPVAVKAVYDAKGAAEDSRNQFISSKAEYDDVDIPLVGSQDNKDMLVVQAISELAKIDRKARKALKNFDFGYYNARSGSTKANSENAIDKANQTDANARNANPITQVQSRANTLLQSDKWQEKLTGAILYLVAAFGQSKLNSFTK